MFVRNLLIRELSVIRHAFSNPKKETGAKAVFENSLGDTFGMTVGISALGIFEGFAIHFLVMQYSHIIAWLLTASTLYFLIWLWGDFNALRSHHSYIDDDVLHVRLGLRHNVDIALKDIASYECGDVDIDTTKNPMPLNSIVSNSRFLKSSLSKKVNLIITTTHPVKVPTPFGQEKMVDSIGLNLRDVNEAKLVFEQMGITSLTQKG